MLSGLVTSVGEPPKLLAKSKGVFMNQNRMVCQTRGFRGSSQPPAQLGFPIKTV
jgi:hypothetical protein